MPGTRSSGNSKSPNKTKHAGRLCAALMLVPSTHLSERADPRQSFSQSKRSSGREIPPMQSSMSSEAGSSSTSSLTRARKASLQCCIPAIFPARDASPGSLSRWPRPSP